MHYLWIVILGMYAHRRLNTIFKLTIRSKIMLGYLIVILCLGSAMFVLNSRIHSMEDEMHFITDHDLEVHNQIHRIENVYLDIVASHRGYIISGDESYQSKYAADKVNIQTEYLQLHRLILDNPVQQKKLEAVRALIDQWVREMGDPTIALKAENKEQDIIAFYKANTGQEILDLLRAQTDDFRSAEKALTNQRIAKLNRNNTEFKNVLVFIFLFVVAISIITSFVLARTIVKTMKQVTHALSEIALEETLTAKRIEVNTQDEIRDLADAANRLLESYENDTWLQAGIAEVAVASQGHHEISQLARSFLSRLAILLHASYGVFYLRSGNHLVKEASYAESGDGAGKNLFQVGEGLIGQCAYENRIIVLEQIPGDHIKIATGLGESHPASILLIPIEYESHVIGVIELASLEKFSLIHRKLVEQSQRTLGVVINNVIVQMEVQRLLAESQALSEELQQQTDELKAQSEELIAQQDELKASNDALTKSEERLQAQQEELEHGNHELEKRAALLESHMRRIEEINVQMEKQNEILKKQSAELNAASKYKSEFLANMSHELRTPLNSLLILSQLLADNKENNLQPKQIEFARTIHSSGNDLLRLIDEILDLSKVEAGRMQIEMDAVDLYGIKENLWHSFRVLAEKKGIHFNIRLEDSLPETLYTDVYRLQQILKNLLSNAFKFTHQGEVLLRVFRVRQDIDAAAQTAVPNDLIAFSVQDTGIGIPKDKKKMIFEAFRQADGSTNRQYGGTGLGLTISRELSTLLGGYIEVESREGEGSAFTLYLPEYIRTFTEPSMQEIAIAQPDVPAVPPNAEPILTSVEWTNPELLEASEVQDDRDLLQPGDRVLLIIEDDVHFAKLLLDMGRTRKFKVLVALQGDQGLALAHAYKPDAIILDIQLPVLDGWSILERLKQHSDLRHIPVHIISIQEESQQGLLMGAMAYLKKPVDKERIDAAFSRMESFIDHRLKRLLIVEDDIVLRDSMVELIDHDDLVITAVSTGEEALRELLQEPFDCMVLDLGLTDISGFELLDRIRQIDKLKSLPIIIYTGKELDHKEEIELKKYAESIILKSVKSQERLFDETALFLHRIEANLPEDRRYLLKKLYDNETALEGKQLLLVEDDIRNIFALTNVLSSYNIQVTFAENGREALELLDKNPNFDLVLTDIMMPEMDGYQMIKAIREQPRFEKLPIIALTAKAMKEDRQRCLDAGASDYISKPIDIDKLLSLLKVWLYK